MAPLGDDSPQNVRRICHRITANDTSDERMKPDEWSPHALEPGRLCRLAHLDAAVGQKRVSVGSLLTAAPLPSG